VRWGVEDEYEYKDEYELPARYGHGVAVGPTTRLNSSQAVPAFLGILDDLYPAGIIPTRIALRKG